MFTSLGVPKRVKFHAFLWESGLGILPLWEMTTGAAETPIDQAWSGGSSDPLASSQKPDWATSLGNPKEGVGIYLIGKVFLLPPFSKPAKGKAGPFCCPFLMGRMGQIRVKMIDENPKLDRREMSK
jgi:hypothetical protein